MGERNHRWSRLTTRVRRVELAADDSAAGREVSETIIGAISPRAGVVDTTCEAI